MAEDPTFDFFGADAASPPPLDWGASLGGMVGGGQGEEEAAAAAASALRRLDRLGKRSFSQALEANLARTPSKGPTPPTPTTPPPAPSPSPTDGVATDDGESSAKKKKVGFGVCSLDGKPLKSGRGTAMNITSATRT